MDNDRTRRTAMAVLGFLLVAIVGSMVYLEAIGRSIPQPLIILASTLSGALIVLIPPPEKK